MSFSFRRTKRHEDVIVDRVTGAFNRRQLDADIAAGLDTSDHSTATLMIDVDRFESYDGKRGNASGEQVLERVAWVIMATVRTTDVVYRHDDSTFCVLLPSTTDEDAVSVADRVRANVAKMPLLADCGVTVSVGVSVGPADGVRESVDRAVAALDEAVRTGQPRVYAGAAAPAAPAPAPAAPVAPVAPTAAVAPTPAPAPAPAPIPPAPPAGAPVAAGPAPSVGLEPAPSVPVLSEPASDPFDGSAGPSPQTPLTQPAVAPVEALRPQPPAPADGVATPGIPAPPAPPAG